MLAALKHRDDYPVVDVRENSALRKTREITFRGTTAEAIELLDAQHEGAVMLMYRTLMHRRKTARADVVAAIEKNMFRLKPPAKAEGDVVVQQERLIDVLADMEREDGGNDIQRLTEKYVAYLERGPTDTGATGTAPPSHVRGRESDAYCWNETLCWLLRKQDEKHCFNKYAERLLNLRKKAVGHWKSVVEGTITELNVDDTLELRAARALMKGVRPVRIHTGPRDKEAPLGTTVYLSSDGKRLRTVETDPQGIGLRVRDWDLATTKMVRQFEFPKNLKIAGVREPDGRFADLLRRRQKRREEGKGHHAGVRLGHRQAGRGNPCSALRQDLLAQRSRGVCVFWFHRIREKRPPLSFRLSKGKRKRADDPLGRSISISRRLPPCRGWATVVLAGVR